MENQSTPQALANLSEEDQAVLGAARQLNSKPTPVAFDSIKLKDSEKKVLDIDGKPLPRGEYYIESYDPAKREKTYRCIGQNPEIVILHRCYTYSWYKEGDGLMAWTSDIQQLDENGYVTLFAKKNGKAVVEFQGRYKPDFKEYTEQNYVAINEKTQKSEKLLEFQNLLYVLFDGKVYRMFVSNASAAGIATGEKAPQFKDPQAGSLIRFVESTNQEIGSALCEFKCRLGSVFRDEMERPFYIRTFENVGRNEKLGEAIAELKKYASTFKDRKQEERAAIHQLEEETKHDGAIEAEIVAELPPMHQPSVSVEDLPF